MLKFSLNLCQTRTGSKKRLHMFINEGTNRVPAGSLMVPHVVLGVLHYTQGTSKQKRGTSKQKRVLKTRKMNAFMCLSFLFCFFFFSAGFISG